MILAKPVLLLYKVSNIEKKNKEGISSQSRSCSCDISLSKKPQANNPICKSEKKLSSSVEQTPA